MILRCCPLARYDYSREGKRDKLQIFGLLNNDEGCPVAIEVFEGNTTDPRTRLEIGQVRSRRSTLAMATGRGLARGRSIKPCPGPAAREEAAMNGSRHNYRLRYSRTARPISKRTKVFG